MRASSGPTASLIAVTPDGKTAYAAASSAVVPINTATHSPGKSIRVAPPKGAEAVNDAAITPDGKTVYVANRGSGTVTVINPGRQHGGEGDQGRRGH